MGGDRLEGCVEKDSEAGSRLSRKECYYRWHLITRVWTEGSTLPHLYCSVINITVLHSPRVAECTVVEETQVQGANSIGCVWINPSAVQGLTALLARSTLGRTATWWRGLWKPLQWLTNLQPSCSPCPLPPASFKLPPQPSRQSDLSNTEIWSH